MADAPDLTLFHSTDLESRVKALEQEIQNTILDKIPVVITGTLPSSTGSSTIAYPTGYTVSNCHVLNLEVYVYGGWRSGQDLVGDAQKRLFTYQLSNGVAVYNDSSNLYSTNIRVTLQKLLYRD